MHRLFIPSDAPREIPAAHRSIEIQLSKTKRHYLKNVVKLKPEEAFTLIFRDSYWQTRYQALTSSGISVIVEKTVRLPQSRGPQLTLAQCLPKQDKFSEILRACTELGVHTFIPLISERTISKPKENTNKQDRWQDILESAAQQSQRYRCPTLQAITPLNEFISLTQDNDLKLVFWEEESQLLSEKLPELQKMITTKPTPKVTLVIGPEGGLSTSEVQTLQENGFISLKLNTPILRVEHAGLVACAQLLIGLESYR